jgi:23S rRNA (uridine2552-2'-O)-methyltransferase
MKVKSKSRKVNKAWLQDHVNDPYVKLAQREGYRARAAYKLKEIDETFRLLRPGQVIVDLGAAPGAWSQYIVRHLGLNKPAAAATTVIALDLLEFEPVEGVQFIQGDFRNADVLAQLERALGGRRVDVIVSDMAPNLSGIESADAARMADLVELAVDFASAHLSPQGVLVAKVFHGSGYSQLMELFKKSFRVAKPLKPKASRDRSAETFLVGIGPKRVADAACTN